MPEDVDGKHHPYLDHHGAVLNIQGFPGKIDFIKNTVKNNMYFINDVFPGYRGTKQQNTPLEAFMKDNQVQMIKCDPSK